jgi:hypothetical protein
MKLKTLLIGACIAYVILLFPATVHAQKDTVPPVITYDYPRDTFCISVGTTWLMQYTITDNQSDNGSIKVNIKWGMNGPVNTMLRGVYPLEINAIDSNGNKSTLKLNLKVEDCSPPQIVFARDSICIKLGDPYTPEPPNVIDNYYAPSEISLVKTSSDVNTNVAGIYAEIYEAVDGSGNKTTGTRIVRVDPNCGTVGISNIPLIHYSVYPQPANEVLNIRLDGNYQGSDLSVRTIDGRLLYQSTVEQSLESIDVAKWPCGIYILHIGTGGFSSVQKIVLQR